MKKIITIITILATLGFFNPVGKRAEAATQFGNTTADRLDCNSAAILDNPTSVTAAAWIYPTTFTNGSVIIGKTRPASGIGWRLFTSGTLGQIGFYWDRTTDMNFVSNNTPLTVNKWYFVAVTADSSGAHIYVGDLTTPLKEVTYGTNTVGSGGFVADGAINFMVGANHNVGGAGSFTGRIANAGYWHNELRTANQLRSWQFFPRKDSLEQRLYVQVGSGLNGTGNVPDLSGNKNTCQYFGSSTLAPHVPLRSPFGN